ncbi:hypothetical protein MJO29_000406, partial [Puccinia striiformis f. sp. tritici]
HLAFSLGNDWFNPWGNKAASKITSLGALVLVCLNLPLSHRSLPANIYLAGITPGHKEPTVYQIGDVLEPLVNDFMELWCGVHFSSTSRHPLTGQRIRAMILQVICDLPAIRKAMGLPGHSSRYHVCSFCKIHQEGLDSIDTTAMVPGGNREAALLWKSAKTKVRKQEIFDKWEVRCTPLLKLPCLLLYSVVEPMHNVFLGVLKYHRQFRFGFKLSSDNICSKVAKNQPEKSQTKSQRTATLEQWRNETTQLYHFLFEGAEDCPD